MKNSNFEGNSTENNLTMFESYNDKAEDFFRVVRTKVQKPPLSKYYHYHDFYELYYLYSGERYYFVKDKTYHVKKGTLVLIKPYDVHYTSVSGSHGYDRQLLHFTREYLNDIAALYDGNDIFKCFYNDISILKLNMQGQHFVETLFKSLEKEVENKREGSELYIKSTIAQLLIFMNRNSATLQDNDIEYINSAHKTVSEITAYINNNYQQDISLSSLANKFYISPYHLSRIFKKNTGFTFVEYLNSIRIKEAQNLLTKTDKSIMEISEIVGYNSSTHFGRIFKNITGTSPLTYKKLSSKSNR